MSSSAKILVAGFCAALALSTSGGAQPASPSGAELIWDLVDTRETLSLTLRRRDGSGDRPFFAACAEVGKIDLRLGAPLDKAPEPGQKVSLTLAAGALRATLEARSDLYQPTGSMEAFAAITADHPLFAVLESGQPVRLERPAANPMILQAADPQMVKLFTVTCRTRTEH